MVNRTHLWCDLCDRRSIANMTIVPSELRIVSYPHPILRGKAMPIESITDEVRAVAQRMIDLMHMAEGVGLAAPQVAMPWRMFVTSVPDPPDGDRVYINPRLEFTIPELVVHEEGCLSIPGINVDIRRPAGVRVTATDLEGNEFTLEDDDFRARVWQHEFDHLNGILIIDKMMPMDRLANRRAIRDLEAAGSA